MYRVCHVMLHAWWRAWHVANEVARKRASTHKHNNSATVRSMCCSPTDLPARWYSPPAQLTASRDSLARN